MAADAETTRALENIATLVKDSNEDSRRRSSELHEKIDNNYATAQESLHSLGLDLKETTVAFGAHANQDEKDFRDVRKRLDAHDGRWWKLLGMSGAGGGLIAGLVQLLTGKGGGG